MKKRIEPIEVEVTQDGGIRISQDYGMNDPSVVVITKEQVPLLVGLLREAEAELDVADKSPQR